MNQYKIEHHEHGTLLIGRIPSRDMTEILKIFGRIYGYDLCDSLIANHYSATMCLTTEYHSNLWRKELGLK